MPWRKARERYPFPDPRQCEADGFLAWGGDLSPERLLSAYSSGVFPWASEPIRWFSPDPRWVLEPHELHVGRSLRRLLRSGRLVVTCDTAFARVIECCASVPRPGQDGTWITDDFVSAYGTLHELGFAHSVETWQQGELVGGLYGVSIGRAFFGESMFALAPDASKVAFSHLVDQLRRWEFAFVDCQVHTDHLARFGARPWPRVVFLERLEAALASETRCRRWQLEGPFAWDEA